MEGDRMSFVHGPSRHIRPGFHVFSDVTERGLHVVSMQNIEELERHAAVRIGVVIKGEGDLPIMSLFG